MNEISPALGIIIMMNNYFHDVATGLLLASGVAIWVITKKYGNSEDREVTGYFLRIYASMTGLARFSLFWILIGGVPRTLFYRRFEWNTAVEHGQVTAIIIKHVLAFAIVGTGAYLWIRLSRRVKRIRAQMNPRET
jgi:hypothetical protein